MKRLIKKLPDTPGVYLFRGSKRAILYIGKATSLHTRVQSYFRRDLMSTRGPILVGMVESATSVETISADSVLEALILEAHLIKKYQPPYNTKEKDNKSFNFVVITKEEFPRVLTMRGRELSAAPSLLEVSRKKQNKEIKYSFGPFPQGSVLREALGLVRKIFPFRDTCTPNQGKLCFNAQIGLCPGVCGGVLSPRDYARTITRIKLFFEGKKKTLIRSLERDMLSAAKKLKFEEASRLKRTIFALNHIQDVALLKHGLEQKISTEKVMRIEAYDVAHISGTHTVGVMVVVEQGEAVKNAYRKFKIRTSKNDDNASLYEMLTRRFAHTEWPFPSLIVVDGGKAQVSTARRVLEEQGIVIPVVGVVKDEHHKAREVVGDATMRATEERAILLANSEAHRFAITYHRTLRGKFLKR